MAAGDRSAVIDAFEAWVHATCTPDDRARFNRSIVEGFVAFTSDGKVEPAHVEQGIRFAREASLPDLPSVERIGALLLAFTRGETPLASPASEPSHDRDAPFSIDLESPPDVAGSPDEPAAAQVSELSVRIAPSSPSRAVAEAVEARPASPARGVSRKLVAGAVAGMVVLGGLVAFARLGGESSATPATSPPAGPALRRLDGVALAGDFPADWREAPGGIVFTGADPAAPEQGVVLTLAAASADVAATARTAERAIAIRHEAARTDYESVGCGTVTLGTVSTGVCSGIAGDTRITVYVRRVGAQDVIAIFSATPGTPEAQATARRIVASLRGR